MAEDLRPAPAAADPRSRQSWASFPKGLAIIMVVAYHSTLYLQHSGVDALLGRAKAILELFPMPVFFLVAGMFSIRQQSWTLSVLWRRRLRPLLYLYVLWSLIRTVFYLVVPGLNGELGELPATSPYALPLILFWPSSSYWFLYALFLFTLAAWLVRRLPGAAQVGLAAVVSTLFTTVAVDTHNIGWNRVGALFVFFVAGVVYSVQIKRLLARSGPLQLLLALLVLVVTAGLILFAGLRGVPFLVLAGQAAAVAAGLIASRYLARVRALGFVGTLGDRSLQIYLLHLYVIVPAAALLALLHPRWSRPVDVGLQVGLVVLTLVLATLLTKLTSRVRWLYLPPRFLTSTRNGLPSLSPATARARTDQTAR